MLQGHGSMLRATLTWKYGCSAAGVSKDTLFKLRISCLPMSTTPEKWIYALNARPQL